MLVRNGKGFPLLLCAGLAVMLLTAWLPQLAAAQETTGSFLGTVRDSSGGVIPGATVTIADANRNVVIRTVSTNAEGLFSAPLLQVGTYNIAVEATGFKKQVVSGLKLDLNQRRQVDVMLQVGAISETVTVEAALVAVESSIPTTSSLISGEQARELSLNNRNWVQLVALSPGVSNDLADQVYVGTTNPEGQANTISISVNGARSSQNTFTVDGADITDRGSNITIQAYPSVDSIGEFKVMRSLYPAESGRSGGGQINIVTRSGSSKFHGSAFEFLRNEALNANNFLTNRLASPQFGRDESGKAKRSPFHYHNFGYTISGPVLLPKSLGYKKIEGKLHFFFSQEFRRDRRYSSATTVSVPDANLRNGIFPFSVCINRPTLGETSCTGQYILPAGTPIPSGFLSPAAQAYVKGIYSKLPLPNNQSVASPYGLTSQIANVADFRQEVVKIDYTHSPSWSFFYRFQHDSIPTTDGNSLFSNGSNLPGVATTKTNSPGKAHTFQGTYIVSPKLIIEGRYAYGYGAILSHNVGYLALANTTVPVTLPFENTRDRVPTVTNNGFANLSSFGPYDNFSYKHNFNGSATYLFGRHTFKTGFVYSMYRKNENALAGNNEGAFSAFGTTYASGQTFPQNLTAANGTVLTGALTTTIAQNLQRWANFLAGNVTTFTQAHYDYTGDLRQKALEAYVQDEFKMRRNVTIYYGLRYSYFPSPYDENGRLTNFDPSLYKASDAPQVTGNGNRVAGTGNFCNGLIVNAQNYATGPTAFNCTPVSSPYGRYVIRNRKWDFAPRFGIAWDPFGKGRTAIRTGYGIYHEQVLVGTYLQNIGANPPYQENVTGSNTRLDNPAAATSASLTVQTVRSVQTDWETPYMQHWSLDIQQQLTRSTFVSVGYYGSKGTHLIGLTEMNDLPVGKALNSMCAPGTGYYGQTPAPTLVACQPAGYAFRNGSAITGNPNVLGLTSYTDVLILDQVRPYRGYRSIVMIQPRYDSNYHSMQVSAQRHFTGASQMSLAYTWSKNLTNNPSDRSNSPQNPYDIKSEYQRAPLDRTHILTINYNYELPFFRQQAGFVGRSLGGWQLSGIVVYNTGVPMTVTTSNLDYAGLGLINANPTARPNLLCDPNADAPQTLEQYFNTACFQTNPTNSATGLPNTPGNAGRGVVKGPSTIRFDLTLAKNIRVWESAAIQLRAEAFNIFNHTNFRTLSTNVTSSSFGTVTAVRDPRTMQLAIKINF
jgi:hypothetical protein